MRFDHWRHFNCSDLHSECECLRSSYVIVRETSAVSFTVGNTCMFVSLKCYRQACHGYYLEGMILFMRAIMSLEKS